MTRTFSITTLGCKVNQYEGASIARALVDAGLQPAPPGLSCDLAVINTCCVTTKSMRKSRNTITRSLRTGCRAILVCGCYSDYDADAVRALLARHAPGCELFVAGHQDDLPGLLEQIVQSPGMLERRTGGVDRENEEDTGMSPSGPAASRRSHAIKIRRQASVRKNRPADANLPAIRHFDNHQRAFVKVQDGCDAFCSYCVVPYTRSVVWSRPIESILAECRQLVASGHREIVLSGVFLGAYGRSTCIRRAWGTEPSALPQLLQAVAQIEGLWRVRLSSIEPGDLSPELLEVARQCPRTAPHFHLPLQSGSDAVLRRMNRQYTAQAFLDTAGRLKQAFDRPTLTADVIVGFPGESDNDFEQTLQVAASAGFAQVHAFPFSAIEGTAAWEMRHRCPSRDVVARRLRRLAELEAQMADGYRRQFIGEVLEAVVEIPPAGSPDGHAMTDRHLPVRFAQPAGCGIPVGTVGRFRIVNAGEDGLVGVSVG